MKISKFNIPEKSIWSLVIYIGLIIIISFVGIIPLHRHNGNTNKNIKTMENQIKEQADLTPQYLVLVKSLGKKDAPALPLPKRTKIPREQTGRFQEEFRTIADKSGIVTVSISPDMVNLTGDSQYLLHNAVVKGEFVNFRRLLINLGSIPYLDRIEEISIDQYPDAMEYKIKLLIELGKSS
jgi:hypothetical protein